MNLEKPMNEHPIMNLREGTVLFYPNIPPEVAETVTEVLGGRWIGQGPKVDLFEKHFFEKISKPNFALAVGSGTDALHLAYLLAEIEKDDEVIVPVFTCTATNIPLLYIGAKVVFADIDDNLNIDVKKLEALITPKTKAIVCVHYGGLPCDMEEIWAIGQKYNIKIIEDAAHALGATYKSELIGSKSDFAIFSFQAIKHITTGDGGMLVIKDINLIEKAKRLRWFGIDRSKKQKGIWDNDINEIGYKYQMNDIAASMGIVGLKHFDNHLAHRQNIYKHYCELLVENDNVKVIGAEFADREHAAWLLTIMVDRKDDLLNHLRLHGIESGQVHYRNDRYKIFGGRQVGKFPKMDEIENKYLLLPIHAKITKEIVERIVEVIKMDW